MSNFQHLDDNDNNKAKAAAIPQVFSKTAKLTNNQKKKFLSKNPSIHL